MGYAYLSDIDHDKTVNVWILLLVEPAICQRHDGGCGLTWSAERPGSEWERRALRKVDLVGCRSEDESISQIVSV